MLISTVMPVSTPYQGESDQTRLGLDIVTILSRIEDWIYSLLEVLIETGTVKVFFCICLQGELEFLHT